MHLHTLVVVVIAQQRLQVFPAVELADDNTFLGCYAGRGVLGS